MISKLPGISAAALLVASLSFGADSAKPDAATLMETACSTCHSLDVVTKQNRSKEDWRLLVQNMVAKGADLKPEQASAVAEYLGTKYLNRGKELVETVCILCHEFARVSTEQLTRDQWAGEIRGMLAEGAPLNDEEFELVLEYLTKTYGPQNAANGPQNTSEAGK